MVLSCEWPFLRWYWVQQNKTGDNDMQTKLRGRDLIGDLDFSKEEVETVLEVAFDLKRKRALGEPHAVSYTHLTLPTTPYV